MNIRFIAASSLSFLATIALAGRFTVSPVHIEKEYLLKPTGNYQVGFHDYRWVDMARCPDPIDHGLHPEDYSVDNLGFCHEIVVRIYYPALSQVKSQQRQSYYTPARESLKELIRTVPSQPGDDLSEIDKVMSFSFRDIPIAPDHIFPVLLMSPGFGLSAQLYENFITDLTSHGFIVIGINTAYINPLELANGHIVSAGPISDLMEVETKYVPLQRADLEYVFSKVHLEHDLDPVFKAMDLDRIGAFGHSIGGRSVAAAVRKDPALFQAAATLDIGVDMTGKSTKAYPLPFMHEISANRMLLTPVHFSLGENGFLVGITPNEDNLDYSYHLNFSDISSLQTIPALKNTIEYMRNHAFDHFSLIFTSHRPTRDEELHFTNDTYTLEHVNGRWTLAYYMNQVRVIGMSSSSLYGLDDALKTLPDKRPEDLTDDETKTVRTLVKASHLSRNSISGSGNGATITTAITTNLLSFFNHFLEINSDPHWSHCDKLDDYTYLLCGPINHLSTASLSNLSQKNSILPSRIFDSL